MTSLRFGHGMATALIAGATLLSGCGPDPAPVTRTVTTEETTTRPALAPPLLPPTASSTTTTRTQHIQHQ